MGDIRTGISTALALVALVTLPLASPARLAATTGPVPHIVGTWPDQEGAGGWVLWSNGRVQAVGNAPFYGDTRHDGVNNVVGMFASVGAGHGGYWLVTATGKVYGFGPVCSPGASLSAPVPRPMSGVIGLVGLTDIYAGFAMVTASGKTYNFVCR